MVKLIMGLKGSGKTKQLIELVNDAVDSENGDIVFIERSAKLTYDIPHKVRLIDASQYEFGGYDFMKGFLSGLHSANYDITHIFIDSVLRLIGKDADVDKDAEEFFRWCEDFSKKERIKFTMSVSADVSKATERLKKFF
jgi:hypothetical protein